MGKDKGKEEKGNKWSNLNTQAISLIMMQKITDGIGKANRE